MIKLSRWLNSGWTGYSRVALTLCVLTSKNFGWIISRVEYMSFLPHQRMIRLMGVSVVELALRKLKLNFAMIF